MSRETTEQGLYHLPQHNQYRLKRPCGISDAVSRPLSARDCTTYRIRSRPEVRLRVGQSLGRAVDTVLMSYFRNVLEPSRAVSPSPGRQECSPGTRVSFPCHSSPVWASPLQILHSLFLPLQYSKKERPTRARSAVSFRRSSIHVSKRTPYPTLHSLSEARDCDICGMGGAKTERKTQRFEVELRWRWRDKTSRHRGRTFRHRIKSNCSIIPCNIYSSVLKPCVSNAFVQMVDQRLLLEIELKSCVRNPFQRDFRIASTHFKTALLGLFNLGLEELEYLSDGVGLQEATNNPCAV